MGTYEDACQELPHTWTDYLDGYPDFLCRLELYLTEPVRFGRGRNFYVNHTWCCHKLLDEMMLNYSQWHTERSPTVKKVNSVEEISSLNEKVDLIMYLLTKQAPIDPHDVPLNSLVAHEQVDVNFISTNNFNNNAYRSNFVSNPRPFPSNNYGNNNNNNNSYGQAYKERDLPSYEKLVEIEKATKN